MYFWEIPWWNRRSQWPWMFWVDPWGEVRVTDPKHRQRYYYTRPCPAHAKVLSEKGWKYEQWGNPEYFYTDEIEIAKVALEALGLPLPDWATNHGYRVYWHEPTYYI